MNTKYSLFLILMICFQFDVAGIAQNTIKVELKDYKRIDEPARDEVSGLVKDPRFKNVLWVHGDSGTKNKIYPINFEGEVLPDKKSEGISIEGIKNRDWEDITIDDSGNVFIADVGNNCSCRTDQTIIKVKAPETELQETKDFEVYKVFYEKPDGFLYRFLNYSMDVEAVFWKDGSIYVLTKRFRGRETKLFKLEELSTEKENEFKLVQTVDFDDEVTGADFAFGKLAVLTYKSLWIFIEDETEDLFDGDVTRYTFDADQVESVTFLNANTILIAEENGELYIINL